MNDTRPTHLDLFSGIGGFALAARWAGFRTVAFVEREPYCQKILAQHWPAVPIYSDICQFGGGPYSGVDLLTGGFPCQPFSVAGEQRGKEDDRYLWPEMLRVIRTVQPCWIIGENVAGLDGLGLDDCVSDLEASGYEVAPPLEIPACAVGARHARNRIWILANANSFHGRASGTSSVESIAATPIAAAGEQSSVMANAAGLNCGDVPNANSSGREEFNAPCESDSQGQHTWNALKGWRERATESEFLRILNGLSEGLDRVKVTHYAMGNETTKERPETEMRTMQKTVGEETIQREAGGQNSFSEAKVLRPTLHGVSATQQFSVQSLLETIPKAELRGLWEFAFAWGSSSGREQGKQSPGQFPNSVREVSHDAPLENLEAAKSLLLRLRQAFASMGFVCHSQNEVKAVWESLFDSQKDWLAVASVLGPFHAEWPGVPRVAVKIPNRTHRLKGLGNAIVPQVAYQIIRGIYQILRP